MRRFISQALPIFALLSFAIVGCSYPLDPDRGENEVLVFAGKVAKVLPPKWKMFNSYNPYGFGTILIRTKDDARFLRLPTGRKWFLELSIDFSGRSGKGRISAPEFVEKERTRRSLVARQQNVYRSIFPGADAPYSYIEYLPVAVSHEKEIIEYNWFVDAMRANEQNFPRYYTESFGVRFTYPEPYEIDGIPENLKTEFFAMVDTVKGVFPKYEYRDH